MSEKEATPAGFIATCISKPSRIQVIFLNAVRYGNDDGKDDVDHLTECSTKLGLKTNHSITQNEST